MNRTATERQYYGYYPGGSTTLRGWFFCSQDVDPATLDNFIAYDDGDGPDAAQTEQLPVVLDDVPTPMTAAARWVSPRIVANLMTAVALAWLLLAL